MVGRERVPDAMAAPEVNALARQPDERQPSRFDAELRGKPLHRRGSVGLAPFDPLPLDGVLVDHRRRIGLQVDALQRFDVLAEHVGVRAMQPQRLAGLSEEVELVGRVLPDEEPCGLTDADQLTRVQGTERSRSTPAGRACQGTPATR